MDPEISPPCSQDPAIYRYLEPDEWIQSMLSHPNFLILILILSSSSDGLYPLDFPISLLFHACYTSCYLILPILIIPLLDAEWKWWSSSLPNFLISLCHNFLQIILKLQRISDLKIYSFISELSLLFPCLVSVSVRQRAADRVCVLLSK